MRSKLTTLYLVMSQIHKRPKEPHKMQLLPQLSVKISKSSLFFFKADKVLQLLIFHI